MNPDETALRGVSVSRRWSARSWLIRSLRLAIATVILIGSGASLSYLCDSVDSSHALYKDFGQDVLMAHAVADGTNPYLPIRELAAQYLDPHGFLDKSYPSPHPPSVGVLFLPFLLLDYVFAVRVWFGIQLICLTCGVGLLVRGANLPVRQVWTPIIAFALLGWLPVALDLGLGQLTTVLLFLLAAAQLALIRGRASVAGGLVGLTLLLKPLAWPWILLFVGQRAWTGLLSMLVVVLIGILAPALRIGWGPLVDYPMHVLPMVSAFYATEPTNISLWTVGFRLFQPTLAAQMVGVSVPAFVLVLTYGWLRGRRTLGAILGVLTCVSVLVNPISWQYYLVLALIPAAHLLEWLRAHRYPRAPTTLAALTGIALYLNGGDWRDLAGLLSSPWIEAGQPVPPFGALLTLGPGLSVGALGLLLARLTDRGPESRLEDRVRRQAL